MENRVRPKGVTADRSKRAVTIEWDDDSACTYSFAGLRAICPCVSCRGGHEYMGKPPDKALLQTARDESLSLENLQAVGSYALQFNWSDGHSTGIYTWDYLYDACQ